MNDKVAVVTGSNKGIGRAVVRELCKKGVGVVYLTARDVQRGLRAVEEIKADGLNPVFHQLDVSDRDSVKKFADHIKREHGGIDILINNAAVIQKDFYEITYEEAKHIIEINYNSYFIIQDLIFPLLRQNARVINVSSEFGHISNLKNSYWIKRLTKEDVQVEDIDAFVNWFLMSIKNGSLNDDDFASTIVLVYRISKIAVCALTRIQSKEIDRNIAINSLHPGYVKTDMTKQTGVLTVEEATQAPIYLALDCDQSVKGKFIWFDKTEKDWTDVDADLGIPEEEEEEVEKLLERAKSA